MPTFPRGFINYQTNVANAQMLEALARETGGNVKEARKEAIAHREQRFEFPIPADLRGVPIQAEGVGGTIKGTNPESICEHREYAQ